MTDLVCYDDLDPAGLEMNDPVAELEQDFYHRLITPPGGNPDDPDFGLGIMRMLSGTVDPTLAAQINAEGRKDDRIDGVQTTITLVSTGIFQIDIQIQPSGTLKVLVDAIAGSTTRLA